MKMPNTDIVVNSSPASNSTAPVHPSSADPSVAGAAAAANANKKEFSMSSTVGSLSELKEKAPEVYDKMMEGIAIIICGRMKDHQERLKKIMREARER